MNKPENDNEIREQKIFKAHRTCVLEEKSTVANCSPLVDLPVLDFKPLVQPPAEKQRLCRNFLDVHTLKVYVDARTFFAQEFCQTNKNK